MINHEILEKSHKIPLNHHFPMGFPIINPHFLWLQSASRHHPDLQWLVRPRVRTTSRGSSLGSRHVSTKNAIKVTMTGNSKLIYTYKNPWSTSGNSKFIPVLCLHGDGEMVQLAFMTMNQWIWRTAFDKAISKTRFSAMNIDLQCWFPGFYWSN